MNASSSVALHCNNQTCTALLQTRVNFCPFCGQEQQKKTPELTQIETSATPTQINTTIPAAVKPALPQTAAATEKPESTQADQLLQVDKPAVKKLTEVSATSVAPQKSIETTKNLNTPPATSVQSVSPQTIKPRSRKAEIFNNLKSMYSLKEKSTWLGMKDLVILVVFCYYLTDITAFLNKMISPLILNEIKVAKVDDSLVYGPFFDMLRAANEPPPTRKRGRR